MISTSTMSWTIISLNGLIKCELIQLQKKIKLTIPREHLNRRVTKIRLFHTFFFYQQKWRKS